MARRSSSASPPVKLAAIIAIRKQLFLKERDAERPPEHRFEHRMQGVHRFPARAPGEIRMHHVADDGPGADQRDFDHEVVKLFGLHARQRRHLRAALHLKHADGVALAQHFVNCRIVGRKPAQIDLFAPVIAHQFEAVFEHGHHAEPEQIDFDEAKVGAVFFVPLDDDAAGHGRGFERHHAVEPPLADHHAAGVLAEVARHVLKGNDDVEEFANFEVVEVEARFEELFFLCVLRVFPAPHRRKARDLVERRHVEAQHLAGFARGEFSAIGDDVRRHRGAVLAVALVDVLDDALALIAAGKIDVDVGPFAALFGEKAFEEQIHADRVDRGDAERVADGAVGRGATALAENSLLFREANQIPDDQEVAAEPQLVDELEFAFDLMPRAVVIRLIAAARAFIGQLPEKRGDGLARGQRIVRKLIAEIGKREAEARRNDFGVGDGFRDIGEKLRHFGRALEVAFGVAREQTAGFGERGFVMQAGEDIEHFALRSGGVADAVGGDQRQFETAREIDRGLIARFFFAIEMALEFDIDVARSEGAGEAGQRFGAFPFFSARASGPSSPPVRQSRPSANSVKSSKVAAGSWPGFGFFVPARSFMRVIRRLRF